MEAPSLLTFDNAEYDAVALQGVIAMNDGLARTICIARVLVENGRQVDLAGLDRGVGLLCAKAFDLPPETGRSLRPHLIALLSAAELLTEALHAGHETSPPNP